MVVNSTPYTNHVPVIKGYAKSKFTVDNITKGKVYPVFNERHVEPELKPVGEYTPMVTLLENTEINILDDAEELVWYNLNYFKPKD
jgi:hypothetical protein